MEDRGPGGAASRPLAAMPAFKGVADWYYEWMRHPAYDPWWQWAELTGKYDRGLGRGAEHQRLARRDVRAGQARPPTSPAWSQSRGGRARDARTQVVIGPWTHGDDLATTRVGAREMGPAAALDYDALVLDWMDRWVQGRRQRRGPPAAGARSTPWAPANGAQARPGRRRPSGGRCTWAARPPTGRPGTLSWTAPVAPPRLDVRVRRRPSGARSARRRRRRPRLPRADRADPDVLTFETAPLADGPRGGRADRGGDATCRSTRPTPTCG